MPISVSHSMSLVPGMPMMIKDILQKFPPQAIPITIVLGLLLLFFLKTFQKRTPSNPSLPIVPGLPLVGNLLQLKEKKPHRTFAKWAEVYGPIYSIKLGASNMVVLNTTNLAKEAMVARFMSISTRNLSKALKILTSDKCMVATSDYCDFYKTAKKNILTGLLGAHAQKQFRGHRDTMMRNMLQKLNIWTMDKPHQPINVRNIVQGELFGVALKQALGKDLESPIWVEELGTEMSKDEIYKVLVVEPMMGAIDVDWRDFFPYLRWVPNKSLEAKIQLMNKRRYAVMKALIEAQKKRIASGEVLDSFIDFMLSEQKTTTEDVLTMLIWEPVLETSDTTLVTTEWAMYELAKNKNCQDRLHREIQSVCGSNNITEEHLPQLPYLNSVLHETLRKHSAVPVLPPRYVREDTQLGGYHIPAGSEIAINIYACNMDKKQWDEPEEWKPERFLEDSKYDAVDMFKTMAFGAGKRICAGSQQAITIACMAIGTLVQEFHWTLKEGQGEDVDTLGLTTNRLHPLQAFVTPRNIRNPIAG